MMRFANKIRIFYERSVIINLSSHQQSAKKNKKSDFPINYTFDNQPDQPEEYLGYRKNISVTPTRRILRLHEDISVIPTRRILGYMKI